MNKRSVSLVILEDEAAHAQAIIRTLSASSENDYNINLATSLKEFDEIISKVQPDLVLADMNLPDGTAFVLLKGELESQPWPIVVMTSYGDEEMAVKAIKSGALDYMVKSPESFRNIEQVVNRNLREWQSIKKSSESERNFRLLFENMEQGVIYQDVNGKIFAANPAAEKLIGLKIEEMQNASESGIQLTMVHEDGSDFSSTDYPPNVALKTGLPVRNTVIGIYRPEEDGYRWLLINATPQFRENATSPYQVFTTLTDITDIKQAEEILQIKNQELKKAKEKAEQSDRFKTNFIANVSHEIRTPMSGILGFAELLKTPEIEVETQDKYLQAIISSGRRMLGIINDLINISKIEAGLVEIKMENVDVYKLLDEMFEFFLPEANKRGIILRINKELNDKYLVETDKTRLSQILTNLINNSLKFTCEGFIDIGCKLDGYNLMFYIKDTGVGISEEHQEQIFERYQGATVYGVQAGVGLGLAISKAYVKVLGGDIWVESDPARGSVFYFTIPYKEPAKAKAAAEIKEDKKIANLPSDVLIAEDEDFIYFYLTEFLKRYNIHTFHAKNGQEAVNSVKANPNIQLILMDGRMPVMNGLEATRQIKKMRPDLPIIALSALANDSDIKDAMEAGCDDYVTKPIDTKELLTKISLHSNPD